jgi:hypothetical protein
MSETVKATIIGTIIIGIFLLISTKMVTSTVWDITRHAKTYVEAQKIELKKIVKAEKRKAKEVFLEGMEKVQTPQITSGAVKVKK